ncbi:MAG: radical SAM protein, partial [Deltaproteobacteria bacterium]|nr:radical SAM protein [Deltaproteobacteria bacterium]
MAIAAADLPSLALLSLAGYTREKGYRVAICDASAQMLTMEQTCDWVRKFDPAIVGISATTPSIIRTAVLAKKLKLVKPGLTIILGGPHATAVPKETINRFPIFDGMVVGEGEKTLCGILDNFPGDAWKRVAGGLAKNGDGTFFDNPPRDLISDIDILPFPAWELLPNFPQSYHPATFKCRSFPAAQYVTARGCPYRCTFCDTSVFSHKVRYHSAEYVLEALSRLYHRFRVREISFEDDTFTMNVERLIAICEGMLKRGLKFTWTCNGRVNNVSQEVLRSMKRAGCWQIAYGIESGVQEILNFVKKGTKISQIKSSLELTKSVGIRTRGYFIIGFPTETEATIRETLNFALSLPLDDLSVMLMTPFPGSELHRIAPQYGKLDDDWSKMNLLQPVFIPAGLSEGKLLEWQRKFRFEFYLRPRTIIANLSKALRNPNLIPRFLKSIYAMTQ